MGNIWKIPALEVARLTRSLRPCVDHVYAVPQDKVPWASSRWTVDESPHSVCVEITVVATPSTLGIDTTLDIQNPSMYVHREIGVGKGKSVSDRGRATC
jgi:hypothetical protein